MNYPKYPSYYLCVTFSRNHSIANEQLGYSGVQNRSPWAYFYGVYGQNNDGSASPAENATEKNRQATLQRLNTKPPHASPWPTSEEREILYTVKTNNS